MFRRLMLACAAVALGVSLIAEATASSPETQAAIRATDYIRTLQNPDGGFPDFGASSTPGGTLDALLAFAAVGIDGTSVNNGGASPDAYLATQAATYTTTSGGAAKLVAGLAGMDIDPTTFASMNTLAVMESYFSPGTGAYGGDVFGQSLYMIAKAALGQAVPPPAVTYLRAQQLPSGGWEYCCGFGEDTNTTALAVRALIAAAVAPADTDVAQGLAYLQTAQNGDGGFPYSPPFSSEANSTGFVIQAIVAAGEDPGPGGSWDLGGGNDPLTFVRSTQNPLTGALQYSGFDNAFATYQGAPGLILAAFPELLDLPPADNDLDFFADSPALIHTGPANASSDLDNCVGVANPAQLNGDGNFIDNAPLYMVSDFTSVNSDPFGDECDDDDDNDGLTDAEEAGGVACGGTTTNPLLRDTDGDRALDGAECALATNPTNASSNPTVEQCAAHLGVGLGEDGDGDRVRDVVEFCYYNSNHVLLDTDSDLNRGGAKDGCEIASVNLDRFVNSGDQMLLAQEILRTLGGGIPLVSMDLNKDGVINSSDQLQMAVLVIPGQCP